MSDSKQPYEALSAVMDAEANEFETYKVYKQLLSDPQALAVWQSHQRVSSLLNDNTRPFAHLDISMAVREAVAGEVVDKDAEVLTASVKHKNALFKSLSVAASVAFAVLVGVKYVPELMVSDQVPVVAANDQSSQSVSEANMSPVNVPVLINNSTILASHGNASDNLAPNQPQIVGLSALRSKAAVEASAANETNMSNTSSESLTRFRRYLLEHTQQSAMASGQGLMPFARVIKFNETAQMDASGKESP
jgi:sigma-E factor negative regulatory protein RseA